MSIEIIEKFLHFNRSKKFNILLSIFSSVVSGFIIIFLANPNYCKSLSPILLILLSLTVIAPVYILNQIISTFLVSKLIKNGFKHLSSFLSLPVEADEMVGQLTEGLTDKLTFEIIYNFPARQLGEFVTIIAVYLSAVPVYFFYNSIVLMYTLVIAISCLTWIAIKIFGFYLIQEVKPKHFDPILKKIRNDENLKKHIAERLDRIENMVKERNKADQKKPKIEKQ